MNWIAIIGWAIAAWLLWKLVRASRKIEKMQTDIYRLTRERNAAARRGMNAYYYYEGVDPSKFHWMGFTLGGEPPPPNR